MDHEEEESFAPAKLIRLTDEPVFAPAAGTSLLWVSNAENELFRRAAGAFFISS